MVKRKSTEVETKDSHKKKASKLLKKETSTNAPLTELLEEEDDKEQEEEDYTETLNDDPYLLKERNEEMSNPSLAWTNKQRTLLFASRGINASQRHLIEDLKRLLPHHKPEAKWDKSQPLDTIPEVADLANCNNVLFFEARKHQDLYMWMTRCPSGPSMKFSVLNIHNSQEMNFLGNHLLGSRPLLIFDSHFADTPYLKLMKEMFVQVWGTPRNHPKSKPFHDHCLTFHWSDNKVWIRNYQIFSVKFSSRTDEQTLIEVGPRLTLDPIRIFDGAFGGKTLWKNPTYESPTAHRILMKKLIAQQSSKRLQQKKKKATRVKPTAAPKLEDLFARA